MPKKISFWNLEPGREYYIEANRGKKYKMEFRDLHGPSHFHDFGSSESAWFIHRGFHVEFDRNDIFYDAEDIKNNAQKAKQQMESRALNMILKRIVNEEFQWI